MQHKSAAPKLPVYFMASFLMVVFLGWVTGASTFASLGNASLIALFVTLGVAWEARHRHNSEARQQPTGRQTHG
jgi:hypothetical protein